MEPTSEALPILLVEDDGGLAELIQDMCDELRLPLAHVTGGRAALSWLRTQQPALMLLDYSLPDMNGAALLTMLEEERVATPPFVVTTGAGDERIAVEMLRRGARDYVVKDGQFLDVLARVVQKVLRALATERELAAAQAALHQLNHDLEHRVAERTAELSASNAALERASRLKDEFLANVSHELRTPLTGILTFAEQLQDQVAGPLNERQTRYVTGIYNSGRHLLDLINRILDFSALEAGELAIHIDPCALDDICHGSLEVVRALVEQKNLRLVLHRPAQNLVLETDGRRVKQILINLLSNAVKFTPPGGAVGLDIAADAAEQICYLTVWDEGIGVASGDQARIFRPFVQLDSRLARQYAGTGLGLALVLRTLNLLGGSVAVESAPGAGSRFAVALPWHPPAAGAGAQLAALTTPAGEPPTVLLAEDGALSAAAATAHLAAWGCQVAVARRGEDALHMARDLHPAAVILSAQLADIDGLALCQRLRAIGVAAPLLLTSALAVADSRAQARAAGATTFLPRPLGVATLHRTLAAWWHPAA